MKLLTISRDTRFISGSYAIYQIRNATRTNHLFIFVSTLPFGSPLPEHRHHADRQQPKVDYIETTERTDHLWPIHLSDPHPVWIHGVPVSENAA